MKIDPLGRMPRPKAGRWKGDHSDPAVRQREAAVRRVVKLIWVKHPPQERVIGQILTYHLATIGEGGADTDGLCLGQDSQAGKTATMERVKHELAQNRLAAGLKPNPYQVVVVGLDQKTSLKSVLQDILLKLDDPDWDYGTEKQLRERIRTFVRDLGVELIIIDECQHLKKGGNDVSDVTDAIKRFLDLGIAPLVLVGNLDAKEVFDRNQQLRARLGLPLELPALRTGKAAEEVTFRNFVVGFEDELVRVNAVTARPKLTDPAVLDALFAVSGGLFGRVARLLKNAAIHASARGGLTVEPYDLSCVTREYAIPSKWTAEDPFSSQSVGR